MKSLIAIWQREPLVILAVVGAAIAVAVKSGVPISDDLKTAIVSLVTAVLVVVARAQVASPATVAAMTPPAAPERVAPVLSLVTPPANAPGPKGDAS